MFDWSKISDDEHQALTLLLNKLAPEAIAEVRQLADSAGTRAVVDGVIEAFLPGA